MDYYWFIKEKKKKKDTSKKQFHQKWLATRIKLITSLLVLLALGISVWPGVSLFNSSNHDIISPLIWWLKAFCTKLDPHSYQHPEYLESQTSIVSSENSEKFFSSTFLITLAIMQYSIQYSVIFYLFFFNY